MDELYVTFNFRCTIFERTDLQVSKHQNRRQINHRTFEHRRTINESEIKIKIICMCMCINKNKSYIYTIILFRNKNNMGKIIYINFFNVIKHIKNSRSDRRSYNVPVLLNFFWRESIRPGGDKGSIEAIDL